MATIETTLFQDSIFNTPSHNSPLVLNDNRCLTQSCGGLFIDNTVSSSLVNTVLSRASHLGHSSELKWQNPFRRRRKVKEESLVNSGSFMCMSLAVKKKNGVNCDSGECGLQNGGKGSEEIDVGITATSERFKEAAMEKETRMMEKETRMGARRRGAINTTKHLWAGAVAAMVSRSVNLVF